MAHWLVALGRVDIHHAVSALARHSHIATEKHLGDAVRIFEHLNKCPDRCLEVKERENDVSDCTDKLDCTEIVDQMKKHHPDAVDSWDPEWPKQKGKPVKVLEMVDADHASDLKTRRSKTGIHLFVGGNLHKSVSKLQKTVADSTHSAELVALGAAVDEAWNLIFTMRSLGVAIELPIMIMSDSSSVVGNSTIPGSPLKKKHEAIVWHKIREGIALGIWELHHIDGTENTYVARQ